MGILCGTKLFFVGRSLWKVCSWTNRGAPNSIIHISFSFVNFPPLRTGSIKKRAEALHRMLTNTVEDMHVNFLAHSMVIQHHNNS